MMATNDILLQSMTGLSDFLKTGCYLTTSRWQEVKKEMSYLKLKTITNNVSLDMIHAANK